MYIQQETKSHWQNGGSNAKYGEMPKRPNIKCLKTLSLIPQSRSPANEPSAVHLFHCPNVIVAFCCLPFAIVCHRLPFTFTIMVWLLKCNSRKYQTYIKPISFVGVSTGRRPQLFGYNFNCIAKPSRLPFIPCTAPSFLGRPSPLSVSVIINSGFSVRRPCRVPAANPFCRWRKNAGSCDEVEALQICCKL